MGSTIVQVRHRVDPVLMPPNPAAVASGMTSMSEAWITRQPRMLDPSKPSPSVKISSLYSVSVVVKCCQVPSKSVNLKSINFTLLSLIILLTSDGVLSLAICRELLVVNSDLVGNHVARHRFATFAL